MGQFAGLSTSRLFRADAGEQRCPDSRCNEGRCRCARSSRSVRKRNFRCARRGQGRIPRIGSAAQVTRLILGSTLMLGKPAVAEIIGQRAVDVIVFRLCGPSAAHGKFETRARDLTKVICARN